MMRQFFYSQLIIGLFILQAEAQSPLGSINIKQEFEVESIPTGDSMLMVINRTMGYYNNKPKIESDLYWMTGTKIEQFSTIKRSDDDNLVGLNVNSNGNLFVYFSEPSKNKSSLKVYKREGSAFNPQPTSLPIEGKVLSSYQDTCLNLVLLEKKTSLLKILKIREAKILSEKIIKIPFKLNLYKDSEIEFIDPSSHVRLDQTFAKVKFFKYSNTINLVLDEPILPFEEIQNPPFKTSLFTYNLETDHTDTKLFFEFTRGFFRSYLIDQFLFKIIDSKEGDRLIVFDTNSQKELINQQILPKEDYEITEGYSRNGWKLEIQKDLLKSLSVVIGSSDQWSPVIMVEKIQNNYIVTAGNFSNNKGSVRTYSSVSPVLGLLVSAVGSAIVQTRENPAMSAYTYLVGSPAQNFSFDKGLDYYKKRIDEFEVSARHEYKFKGYLATQNWSAGLYMLDGSTQLSFVVFPK